MDIWLMTAVELVQFALALLLFRWLFSLSFRSRPICFRIREAERRKNQPRDQGDDPESSTEITT